MMSFGLGCCWCVVWKVPVFCLLCAIYLSLTPVSGRYVYFPNKYYWYNSHETCRSNGLGLVTIQNTEKLLDLMNYMQDAQNLRGTFTMIWVGLHYNNQTSRYQWTDETAVSSSVWNTPGPDHPFEEYPCVCVDIRTGALKNRRTKSHERFVCEEKDIPDPPVIFDDDEVFPVFSSFIKRNSTVSNIPGQSSTGYYERGLLGRVYTDSKLLMLEDCIISCDVDPQCVSFLFYIHPPNGKLSNCIFHKLV